MKLEEELKRTFSAAAERMPDPLPGLGDRVARRYRRRRRRGQALLAAGAVAVVLAGSVVAAQNLPDEDSAGSVVSSGGTVPPVKLKGVRPADQVWPDAVRNIPGTLPDGSDIWPTGFIDDATVLIRTDSATTKRPTRILAYDLKTGNATQLAELKYPGYTEFATGGGWVVWSVARQKALVEEIWGIPVGGGTPKRLTKIPVGRGEILSALGVADGKIIAGRMAGGVYEAPLSGGKARPVKGTEGHQVLSWPWTSPDGPTDEDDGKAKFKPPDYENIHNVKTGKRRSAVVLREGRWSCNVTWCIGEIESKNRSLAQRRDGSGLRSIPAVGDVMEGPIRDRFTTTTIRIAGRNDQVLYDIKTGRAGALHADGNGEDESSNAYGTGRFLACKTKNGFVIFDLDKIK